MTDYSLGRAHHPGPYHPSWEALRSGDWVLWAMPTFVKVGQVVLRSKASLVVQFQAHPTTTVIPDAYQYWDPDSDTPAEYSLTRTATPAKVLSPPSGPSVSVRQAAALIGCGPKDVRRMLRAGQLAGEQREGRWVAVELASLSRAAPRTPDTG